jgi:hypothetical protein
LRRTIIVGIDTTKSDKWGNDVPNIIIIAFGFDVSFTSASLVASDAVPNGFQGVAGSFTNVIVNYVVEIGLSLAGAVEVCVNSKGMIF